MYMNYNKKGGVILTETWKTRPSEALMEFIQKCRKVKILTDNSISCVTYVFSDLPSDFVSPYIAVRSNNLQQPVNKILFKIGFISNRYTSQYLTCRRSSYSIYQGQIEAVTKDSLIQEVETQDYLFKESIRNTVTPFEPICPSIICYTDNILFNLY